MAHHGAKEATTKAFLNKAKPKYAVISVGKKATDIQLQQY